MALCEGTIYLARERDIFRKRIDGLTGDRGVKGLRTAREVGGKRSVDRLQAQLIVSVSKVLAISLMTTISPCLAII